MAVGALGRPSTVDWLRGAENGVPVAAADPAPRSAAPGLNSPITLTFDEPVAKAVGTTPREFSPSHSGDLDRAECRHAGIHPAGVRLRAGHRGIGLVRPPGGGRGRLGGGLGGSGRFGVLSLRRHAGLGAALQEILAQLHYLPLNFTPAPGVRAPTTLAGEVATLGSPLKGSFSWRWHSTPAALGSKWQVGSPTVIVKGALMAFMAAADSSAYNGYTADAETVSQLANALWKPLLGPLPPIGWTPSRTRTCT